MRFKLAIALVAAVGAALWGTTAATAGPTLSTDLVGLEERPGPGDPDGHGSIDLTIHQGRGEICFNISLFAIDTVTGGHIHKAPAGQAGPVFITLFGSNGFGTSCVSATKAQLKEIRQNPELFYVNVHTTAYPNGAVRGQLGD